MNDLLKDSFVTDSKDWSSRSHDVEKGNQAVLDVAMEPFDKQIQEIEKQMESLPQLLQNLKDANEESMSITKASAMKAIKKRMERDIDQVQKVARNVKSKLETVNKENLANRQLPGCEKGTAVDRLRMNMASVVTKKFATLMTEFQMMRQRIREEYREVVERRVMTVTGIRPDEKTIDDLIETGSSEEIFKKAMHEQGRGQFLNTVEEIQERHDAVREIEKKLLDLHQIYLDMAVLIQAQQDILDNIEIQVTNAVEHVNMGAEALQTAKQLQKRSRKCIIIVISILLIIAIIVVLSVLKPWKKK
ncbi:syntaxin-132-like [Impatiens glandulifera]|uniref:syntaxin-132-like n=1 Tax=Impatiens glandulifera TaxID=253017 RepID=UPI001FB06607|nr:syntaxin-132-like [Impatiens glandulifera]